MTWAFVLVLALRLGGVVSRSPAVDGGAVEAALAIRTDDLDAWTIEIDDAGDGQVAVVLEDAAGDDVERTYRLAGTTVEERSRELAAALALLIEQRRQTAPTSARTRGRASGASTTRAPPQGWLALGARMAVGSPPDPDGGATLRGGAWWGRRILQPIGQLATVHARRGDLRVDGVRIGAGLAVGAPWQRWWFGGAVMSHLAWMRARERGSDASFGASHEITGLVQWRAKSGLFVGARTGAELTTPPQRARGGGDHLRLGLIRFMVGAEVGVVLPW